MEKFSKEMLSELARQVMIDLNDEELSELQEEFETYLKQMDLLNRIDTEGVEEMVYPFETPTVYIRNDEDVHTISQEMALKNAPKASAGHVLVPKVVK